MIAGYGFTSNDQTTLPDFDYRNTILTIRHQREIEIKFTETKTQRSLRLLKERMFVNPKIKLKKNFNVKTHNLKIRNQLPQRIRLNEKPIL